MTNMRYVFENKTNQCFRLFLIVSSIAAVTVTLLSAAYGLFVKCQRKRFCSTKKSAFIISIRDVCKKVTKKKLLLLIPIISAALQILAISSSLSASISLTTGKAPQFRVVDSCHEELCVSNDTKTFFQEGDLCRPEEFRWAENTSIWHLRRSWNFVRDKILPPQNCLLLFVPGSAPGVQKPIVSFTA